MFTTSGVESCVPVTRALRTSRIALRVRPYVKAAGLKVDRSLIAKLEQGRVPSWPLLGALSAVYGVPVAETSRLLMEALRFPAAEKLFAQNSGPRQTNAGRPHPQNALEESLISSPGAPDATATTATYRWKLRAPVGPS